jgi:ribonuclease P protein component
MYERGRIFNDPLLVLRVLANELPHNRYGFVVSGKVGGAVVRNRVRRRLQEIVRLLGQGWGPDPQHENTGTENMALHHDLLLSCKAAAAKASYQQLETAVRRLFVKGGLLSEGETS